MVNKIVFHSFTQSPDHRHNIRLLKFEWKSPLTSVTIKRFGKHSKIRYMDTTLSTVLLKAKGYKTLTSSRGRAVQRAERVHSLPSLPQSWTWQRNHVLRANRVSTKHAWCDSNATEPVELHRECGGGGKKLFFSYFFLFFFVLRMTNQQNRAIK